MQSELNSIDNWQKINFSRVDNKVQSANIFNSHTFENNAEISIHGRYLYKYD